jgi:hypothetical protein
MALSSEKSQLDKSSYKEQNGEKLAQSANFFALPKKCRNNYTKNLTVLMIK